MPKTHFWEVYGGQRPIFGPKGAENGVLAAPKAPRNFFGHFLKNCLTKMQ